MGHNKGKETITVESLLRIKRSERPDGEFWDSFENDFQRRRLNALVERDSTREPFWIPVVKFLSFGLPAVFVAGLAFLWTESQKTESIQLDELGTISVSDNSSIERDSLKNENALRDIPQLAVSEGRLSSQFVMDAIRDETTGPMNFRKVLYTPAIHLSTPNGAFYVKDSFSSRNYKVTTADVKLGRNF